MRRLPGGGEQFGEPVGGVGAHAGQDVLVGGPGEAGVGVAEAFGHERSTASVSGSRSMQRRLVGVLTGTSTERAADAG